MTTSQFEREIRQQPDAMARLLASGRDDAERIASRIRAAGPRFVMVVARGTSDNAARYAQYLLGAHNRLSVALVLPEGIPEWLSPIVSAVLGQIWVLELARAKRVDPDHPRGLSKVTRTR